MGAANADSGVRGCLKSRLVVTDRRRVMPITINTDKLYDTDLTDAAWTLIAPMLPAARPGGRPRTTNIRAVLNAIFYLLRTGCQWRLLPREFRVWSTVYHYFRAWKNAGVWTCIQRSMYQQARGQAGRAACPSVESGVLRFLYLVEGQGNRVLGPVALFTPSFGCYGTITPVVRV